jgi:DNA-directed RNA polymerase subunit RPC12/RpoP
MFRFPCEKCGQRIKAEPIHAGRKGKCPKCGHAMRIPEPPAAIPTFGKSPAMPPPIPQPIIAPLPPPVAPSMTALTIPEPHSELTADWNAIVEREEPIPAEIASPSRQVATFPNLSDCGEKVADYLNLAKAICHAVQHLGYDNAGEAKMVKKQFVHAQKLLRQVKRRVSATVQSINATYQNNKSAVGTSFGSGVARWAFGARTVGRFNAAAKQDLRNAQLRAVAPYKEIRDAIDQTIFQLDAAKDEIDRYVSMN